MPKPSPFSPEARATKEHVDAAIALGRGLQAALKSDFVDKLIASVEMMPPWTRVKDWTNWHVNTFVNLCLNHLTTLPAMQAQQGMSDGISAIPVGFTPIAVTVPVPKSPALPDNDPETPST